jgi:hypothetical protein
MGLMHSKKLGLVPLVPLVVGGCLVLGMAFTSHRWYRQKHMQSPSPSPSAQETTPSPTPSVATPPPVTTPQPSSKPPSPKPTTSTQGFKWGAYTGHTVEAKQNFEQRVGTSMDYVAAFVHWGNENELPLDLASEAKKNNQTLVIFWESKDYNNSSNNDSRFSYDAILRGDWDTYIRDFGEQIRATAVPIILIPFEEVNGDWSPWSLSFNDNTAEKHRQAYQKIAQMYAEIPLLQMGWAVNNDSHPESEENSIGNLYPGSTAVDIVGVDGFNFDDGEWLVPSEIFDSAMQTLKVLGKPIIIFSTASAQGSRKAEWIGQLGSYLRSNPELKGVIWFNENKEKDWRVWSDQNSLSAFKTLIGAL